LCQAKRTVMTADKSKSKNLQSNIQLVILELLANDSPAASAKLSKGIANHAKKIARKYLQTVGKLEKKAAKELAKQNHKKANASSVKAKGKVSKVKADLQ